MEYYVYDKGGILDLRYDDGEIEQMWILAKLYVPQFEKNYIIFMPLKKYQTTDINEKSKLYISRFTEEDKYIDLQLVESIYEWEYLKEIIDDILSSSKKLNA